MQFILQIEDLDMQSEKQQLLYFYCQNMAYHPKYMIALSKLEEQRKDIIFVAIDIGEFSQQCRRFAITTLPSFLLVREGKELKRINGYASTEQINQLLG